MDKWIGKWAFPPKNLPDVGSEYFLEQTARRGDQYNFKKIAADIISKVQFEPDDVTLDVCCGNAALTALLASVCKKIHGVDFSEMLLHSGEKLMMQEGILNMELHRADAMKIDEMFPEDTFDKSCCYFSFQYFNRRKRELLLEKLSRVTKRKGWIFIGDVPDKTRMWNFYETRNKYYREKISRILKLKEGECDLGWWVNPNEIIRWCEKRRLSASILKQENLPHAHYRFDVLIRNSK